ncbi:Lipid A biosynthesis lauroyl acyltransferase [Aquimixticola soesokkakensis]|uniref:Lipid A biosynthesis lauroyl acyltransferase n=1 Tax=Aquimixticola soesokkakensis TaxID=1519096 RepID=A0A1Y5SPW0_9RHOB|nr:lauroyl acyltransferase [Aquimixticola soesokkakensis]SLN45428.1 Lipid A biosynthesis lauroyl acyltransferase [Aquimixticola soesokkakensis]
MTDSRPAPKAQKPTRSATRDALLDRAIRGVLWAALRLPYRHRVPAMGWVMAHLVSPLAGYRARIRDNLAYVLPELPATQARALMRKVPDNVGRTLIEIYSGPEFINRIKDIPLKGEGAQALQEAYAAQRPVVLVTGHFGNYDVARGALVARGYPVGGIYNPMKNAAFNTHYVRAIETIGTPLFARGRRGMGGMLKHLKGGGMIGIVVDQYVNKGALLRYFDKPARTALSAAELALKFDALLIPIYGIRQANGLDFDIRVEAPIPASDAQTMTQALNDSLEALTRRHMDQWFWIHRRWKPDREARRAAKLAPPKSEPAPD